MMTTAPLAGLNPPERIQRILVIQVARFGDTLLTGVALRALKEAWPMATIDFLGHPKRYRIVEGLPELHRVGAISKKSAPFKGWLCRLIGHKSYDLAVVWGHDAALLRYAQRVARHLVVQQIKNERVNVALRRAGHIVLKMPSDKDLPLADWLLTLIERGLGITTKDRRVAYVVSPAEQAWAQGWLQQAFSALPDATGWPLIGLIIESFPTYAHRDWPAAHFAALCRGILAAYPSARFVLLGSQLPESKICLLHEATGGRFVQAAGHLDMRQSAGLMQQLDLYIGLDTGPSHIAAGIGVPMICLFHCARRGRLVLSPVKPEVVTMIEHPCSDAECSFQVSMAELSPEVVLAATLAKLHALATA